MPIFRNRLLKFGKVVRNVGAMAVWDDPAELGKRLIAARNYAGDTQDEYAPKLGVSPRTLAKMEKGQVGSLGKSPAVRKGVAEAAVAAGAPPEFFGLDELQHVTRAEMAELIAELRSSREGPPEEPGGDEDG